MKRIIFIVSICLYCIITSCSEIEQISVPQFTEEFTNEYDMRAYDFAVALNKAISENEDLRNFIKNEVVKQFDGDYDLLLSHAFNQNVRPSDIFVTKSGLIDDEISVKELLSYYYTDTCNQTKSSEESLDNLVNDYPELQISVPVHAEDWDSDNYIPDIAIVPNDYEEFVTEKVPGINAEGENIEVDAINEPDMPTIVVGLNERLESPRIIVGPQLQLATIRLNGEYSDGAIRIVYTTTGVTNVHSILLYRTGANNSMYSLISPAFAINNQHFDWTVSTNKEYSYYVVAECTTSTGTETLTSNILTIQTNSTLPSPVSNLSVTSHYGTKNFLSWDNPSPNGFPTQIFRTTPKAGETNKLIATLPASEDYYEDEPVTPGEKWFYYVKKYNPNTTEVSSFQQAFLYNPYRDPSGKSKVMLKKVHINRTEVESWLAGKPEFYITTYGYQKRDDNSLKLDTLSTIDFKFNDKSDDSQDLNHLMADWSFFDDSEYYPILNINVREYDKVTFSTTINAEAKIGKKLTDDISVVAKGTFTYKFQNKNKDCGTVMLRYYENPEQNLTFANYGTYITISENDDFN